MYRSKTPLPPLCSNSNSNNNNNNNMPALPFWIVIGVGKIRSQSPTTAGQAAQCIVAHTAELQSKMMPSLRQHSQAQAPNITTRTGCDHLGVDEVGPWLICTKHEGNHMQQLAKLSFPTAFTEIISGFTVANNS